MLVYIRLKQMRDVKAKSKVLWRLGYACIRYNLFNISSLSSIRVFAIAALFLE